MHIVFKLSSMPLSTLTVRVSAHLARTLKIYAAQNDYKPSAVLEAALKEYFLAHHIDVVLAPRAETAAGPFATPDSLNGAAVGADALGPAVTSGEPAATKFVTEERSSPSERAALRSATSAMNRVTAQPLTQERSAPPAADDSAGEML
jgi:predicted transcriptional regulator